MDMIKIYGFLQLFRYQECQSLLWRLNKLFRGVAALPKQALALLNIYHVHPVHPVKKNLKALILLLF